MSTAAESKSIDSGQRPHLRQDRPLPSRAPSLVGIRHIGRVAQDPVALAAFYRDVMGMEIVRQTPPGSALGTIAFLGCNTEQEDHDIVFASNATAVHTAFRVESLGDLLAFHQRFQQLGVPTKSINHAIEFSFYFEDPEGNAVEIYWVTGVQNVRQLYAEPIDLEVPEEHLRLEVDRLTLRFAAEAQV